MKTDNCCHLRGQLNRTRRKEQGRKKSKQIRQSRERKKERERERKREKEGERERKREKEREKKKRRLKAERNERSIKHIVHLAQGSHSYQYPSPHCTLPPLAFFSSSITIIRENKSRNGSYLSGHILSLSPSYIYIYIILLHAFLSILPSNPLIERFHPSPPSSLTHLKFLLYKLGESWGALPATLAHMREGKEKNYRRE